MAQQIRKQPPAVDPMELVGFVCCYGDIRDEDPSLVRQREAGEEDQSEPGWDQGA